MGGDYPPLGLRIVASAFVVASALVHFRIHIATYGQTWRGIVQQTAITPAWWADAVLQSAQLALQLASVAYVWAPIGYSIDNRKNVLVRTVGELTSRGANQSCGKQCLGHRAGKLSDGKATGQRTAFAQSSVLLGGSTAALTREGKGSVSPQWYRDTLSLHSACATGYMPAGGWQLYKGLMSATREAVSRLNMPHAMHSPCLEWRLGAVLGRPARVRLLRGQRNPATRRHFAPCLTHKHARRHPFNSPTQLTHTAIHSTQARRGR